MKIRRYCYIIIQTIPTACSVAIAGEIGGKIVLVGGELEPSARKV